MRHVGLCGLARVMSCVQHMSMGSMRVISSRLMMTSCVMPSGFLVMLQSGEETARQENLKAIAGPG
jgi:hypothetical protein